MTKRDLKKQKWSSIIESILQLNHTSNQIILQQKIKTLCQAISSIPTQDKSHSQTTGSIPQKMESMYHQSQQYSKPIQKTHTSTRGLSKWEMKLMLFVTKLAEGDQ